MICMTKLRRKYYCQENKEELSAAKILNRISSREGFNVSEYFKARIIPSKKMTKFQSLLPLKVEKKRYYDPWEIKSSMKCTKMFRSRCKEVIDKIKLKHVENSNVNFGLSPTLKERLSRTSTLKKLSK